MGNHDQRFTHCQGRDCFLHNCLILWIDICSRLVQNDHRGVLQHGAGNGDPLPLTAGKMGTGASDNGIIPLIQLADKGVTATLFCCLLHLRICGVRPAHADIFPDAAVKQVIILRYIGNLGGNFRQRYLLQFMAAQGNTARRNIPIPSDQLRHGRFAGTGRSYKGGHGSRLDGKAHIMQHFVFPIIGKGNMVESDTGICQIYRRIFMIQFFRVQ